MRAPDKIYLPNEIDMVSAALLTNGTQDGVVSYLRKDTILEWAKGLEADSARRAGDNDAACGYHDAIMDLIDKLNSL